MSGITDDDSRAGGVVPAKRPLGADPAFKLFGKTIPVVSSRAREAQALNESRCFQGLEDAALQSESQSSGQDDVGSSSGSNDGCDESDKAIETVPDNPPLNPNLPVDKVKHESCCEEEADDDEEEEAAHTSIEQEAPKKPDKPVPCPRCQSLDTKFCYYNNYNMNQPRHFCKNCQRYWTAGGTLRNVPVGAGRRKSKHCGTGGLGGQRNNGFPDGSVVRGDAPEIAHQMVPCHGTSSTSAAAKVGKLSMNMYIKTGVAPSSDLHSVENSPEKAANINMCIRAGVSPTLSLHSVGEDSPARSTVLNFGQECTVPKAKNVPMPVRSEVLQGYKPTTTLPFSPKVEVGFSAAPPEGSDMNQFSCYKQISPQGVGTRKPPCTVPVLHTVDPVARFPEHVQVHMPASVTTTSSTSPSTGEVAQGTETAPAWVTNPQFSLVNNPWQYGWGSMPPAATYATAAQDITTHSNNSATASHTHQAANMPPWAAALWSGVPWPLMQNPLLVQPAWAGAWPMPWAAPVTAAAAAAAVAAATAASAVSAPYGSSVLGKHPRDQGETDKEKSSGTLLVPKTLRIGDPDEAAQSSIWTSLGLGQRDTCSSGGIFSNLHLKDRNDPAAQEARDSNPAALRRSVAFQESNLGPQQHVDVKGK